MRIGVKTGLIAAACWITFRLSAHYLGFFVDTPVPEVAVLLNIFGLLVAISIGLYLEKRKQTEESNALFDMKNAMSAGVPYVVLVSIFIYFFYHKINPECYQHQVAENDIAIERMVNDPVQLEKFKREQQDAEVMTKEQIESKLKQSNRQGASAGFTSTLTVLAMIILATLYSLLITIIMRKVVFRN
jgi:uncharacterized membrane protein YraQ (UPF0718 family)